MLNPFSFIHRQVKGSAAGFSKSSTGIHHFMPKSGVILMDQVAEEPCFSIR